MIPAAALLFHGAALCCLLMGVVALRRSETDPPAGPWAVLAAVLFGGLALVAAHLLAFGTSRFLSLRLTGHLVFGYVPLGLLLAAWLGKRYSARHRWVAAVFAVTLMAVAVWSFGVEPRWLDIGRYRVTSPEISEPLRIAVVADFQTDHMGAFERRVLSALMAERADLILWPGDYLQTRADQWPELAADFNASLHAVGLSAPLGVFASRGDADPAQWPRIFAGLPVRVESGSTAVRVDPGSMAVRVDPGSMAGRMGERKITVTSLSVADSRFGARLEDVDGLHIVFGHAPDFALHDVADADVLIAGHTHGGQVRLPFVGPLITLSRVPRAWAAGQTELPGGAQLFVSRGIGMERGHAPRLRFLCRPELMIIDVIPAS